MSLLCWMVSISFSPIPEKWSLKADKSSSRSLMLLLSNLISFTEELWIFLKVDLSIICQVILELPSFSFNTFLENFSLACLISLFTALWHFLNIMHTVACIPRKNGLHFKNIFIMHSSLQLRCDPGWFRCANVFCSQWGMLIDTLKKIIFPIMSAKHLGHHNCLPCPNLVLKYTKTWQNQNCWISYKLL